MNYPKPQKQTKEEKRIKSLEKLRERQKRQLEKLKDKVKKKPKDSIANLKKKAQKVFNAWIRERDKGLPCISCGKDCGKAQAGHYVSQGSSGALRYHPDNVSLQGAGCNLYKHGNLIEYRIGLVKKIGIDRVVWLEEHRNDVKKWNREELEEIIEKYKLC